MKLINFFPVKIITTLLFIFRITEDAENYFKLPFYGLDTEPEPEPEPYLICQKSEPEPQK